MVGWRLGDAEIVYALTKVEKKRVKLKGSPNLHANIEFILFYSFSNAKFHIPIWFPLHLDIV